MDGSLTLRKKGVMYVILGRGGVLNTLLALPVLLLLALWWTLKLAYYAVVTIIIVVIFIVRCAVAIVQSIRKRRPSEEVKPPEVAKSPVSGPRDWTPPE